MWYLVAMCDGAPAPCPVDPATYAGLPGYDLSVIGGAKVTAVDSTRSAATFRAAKPSASAGEWIIDAVPFRTGAPYFALSEVGPAGRNPVPPANGFPVPPAATYVRTLDLKPIVADYTVCMGQQTVIMGNNGILEAVAKYLTSTGTPTTVQNLLEPAKYSGVVVLWLMQPYFAGVHVPAFGTKVEASHGTVLNIDWAPPGSGSAALQSARGFLVDPSPAASPMGIAVVLLRPADAGRPLTVVAKDPVTKANEGRPWEFPSIPPIEAASGMISFREVLALAPGVPLSPWTCWPK
jgi:hypothetical protein